MASMPPIGESNYPRPALAPAYGTADKLQALGDSYYGLSWVFLLTLVMFMATGGIGVALQSVGVMLGGALLSCIVVGFVSFSQTKKLGFGLGWPPAAAVVAAIVLGSTIGGLITYVVLQMMAAGEIKKYGVPNGAFGFRKKAYLAVLADLRVRESHQPVGLESTSAFSAT